MLEDLNTRLEGAKQRLDQWRRLKTSLPQAQERLSEEAYRLRRVDNYLHEVKQQVDALESLTLESLVDGLLGRKERKLGERRDELTELQRQYDEGEETLIALEHEVCEIKEEVARLGGSETAYKSLCDEKRELILAAGDERADHLMELAAELDAVKAERHAVRTAIQIGKNLLERLHTMTNSLGRARNRLLYGGPLGLVGYVAFNAVTRHGTDTQVGRARDGLAEFNRCIDQLNHGNSETDREIVRLGTALMDFHRELSGNRKGKLTCDMSVTLPILEHVQNTVSHLRGKLEHLDPQIAALDERQRLFVENA